MPTPMLGVEVGYLGSQNDINESLNQGRWRARSRQRRLWGRAAQHPSRELRRTSSAGTATPGSTAPRPPASGTAPPIHCPSAVVWNEHRSLQAGRPFQYNYLSATSTPQQHRLRQQGRQFRLLDGNGRSRSIVPLRNLYGDTIQMVSPFRSERVRSMVSRVSKRQPHETRG